MPRLHRSASSAKSLVRPHEMAGAVAVGGAMVFGAKYIFAGILIIFTLLGNQ